MTYLDQDPQGTLEWQEAFDALIKFEGTEKAHYILQTLVDQAREKGLDMPYSATTEYINTIPVSNQPHMPAGQDLENKLRSIIRWNALAMVVKANRSNSELGGHLASYASSATLYEVGFNHFYKGGDRPDSDGGDMVFFQGHSAPGIYARAFLEGRISEEQLLNFRQEVDGHGISSYPHPWLMPDFWQFPTVSMGLGPIMGIYQARFMKYLEHRGLIRQEERKVWVYLGDGEMDEPESLGAIHLASREELNNLVFVINCNLQRLDGPVRGNGKIIQELEGNFRGAGWNVIKVIWGSNWDQLLERDKSGMLKKRMMEVVDGDYQTYKAKGGAYVREHFFGKYPETLALVKDMSDDDIYRLTRGGHDPRKIYAAYKAASETLNQPSVILAKTVKGYGMQGSAEGANTAHQTKKLDVEALKLFRDRFGLPIPDETIDDLPFYKPPEDSAEMKLLNQKRKELGGVLPARKVTKERLTIPDLNTFKALLEGTGSEREMSTTMAFVRFLSIVLRDSALKDRIVPIVPDEARTFGMEGLFRQLGIYAPQGQCYTPEDSDQMMWYKEAANGQVLEEGINEAGAMCSWIAAATAYANHNKHMIPFYIYYSMFGYQRIGDLVWAAGDMQARGFLMGGTAGRTTLAGEGLQHQDGHHHLMFGNVPNCRSYDPTFSYELTVIMHDGMKRMYAEDENCFYYLSVMNENYAQPTMPKGCEEGIIKGMYLYSKGSKSEKRVQLMGSGTILREVIAAAALLKTDFNIESDIWSVTSFNELRKEGFDCERFNQLNPDKKPKISYVSKQLNGAAGPVIAATDYVRQYADQIRSWIPNQYVVLGTDGYGRSDSRSKLRHFFEVDRSWIAITALKALADEGKIKTSDVKLAIKKYGIDINKPNPLTV